MQLTERYEPAGKDVVAEEIDGEVVIVNLRNGNYYSLTQSATLIWAGIQEHASVVQIRERIAQRYRGDTYAMNRDMDELIRALEGEQLIRRLPDSGASAPNAATVTDGVPATAQIAYLPPIFECFTDMGDLLLLDPVHEAEEGKGWPHGKGNT